MTKKVIELPPELEAQARELAFCHGRHLSFSEGCPECKRRLERMREMAQRTLEWALPYMQHSGTCAKVVSSTHRGLMQDCDCGYERLRSLAGGKDGEDWESPWKNPDGN